MIKLYGIANCDTVKKARAWLTENRIEFEFVDFKQIPPDAGLIGKWLKQVPLESLLNKRGTTWRKLDAQAQAAAAQEAGAVDLMRSQPSIIKRPILEKEDGFYVGFSDESYRRIFSE